MGGIDIGEFSAAALAQGTCYRATVTVGTSVTSLTAPSPPTGFNAWKYLIVHNRTADTWVAVALNENPTVSAADPPSSVQWGVGQDVLGGGSAAFKLEGPVTTIRLLASAASTAVVLDLVA